VADETPEASRPADLPAVSKLAAGNALRERMKNTAGLAAISAAAAGFIYDHFEADASAISVLKGDWYRTIVTVGEEVPGQVRHDDGETYPSSEYPTVTRLLRSGSGYVASIGSDGGVPESQRFLKQYRKSSCIGAPITYRGDVVGEVFASRASGRPHYTGHDLVSLLDLARQIGYRVGPAIKAQDTIDPSWWPEGDPVVGEQVARDGGPDPLA
jgi:GAF domain-containing protein